MSLTGYPNIGWSLGPTAGVLVRILQSAVRPQCIDHAVGIRSSTGCNGEKYRRRDCMRGRVLCITVDEAAYKSLDIFG